MSSVYNGFEAVEDPAIAGRGGVVDLVGDHVIERAGREAGEVLGPRELLDRREHDLAGQVAGGAGEPGQPGRGAGGAEHAAQRAGSLGEELVAVGEHEHAGAREAALGGECDEVERGEPGLAQAGGEHDQGAAAALGTGGGEGGEGLALDAMRVGQGLDRLAGVVRARRDRGGAAAAVVVGVDPGGVEGAGAGPPALEGAGDAGVGLGVARAVGAEVPFDAGAERGPRDVAGADVRDARRRGLEAPCLGVERAGLGVERRGLDHAGLEATRGAGPGRGAGPELGRRLRLEGGAPLRPVEQLAEGLGLRDLERVAGDEADAGAAAHGGEEVRLEQVEAALLDERGDDGDVGRVAEQGREVLEEMVGGAAGRQWGGAPGQVVALARDDVANAAARVGDVAAAARDDVHVEVHHRLASRLAGVEADVVAVRGRGERGVEEALHLVHEGKEGGALLRGGLEPGGDLAARDDQGVAVRDRIAVEDREREVVGGDPVAGRDGEERGRQREGMLPDSTRERPVRTDTLEGARYGVGAGRSPGGRRASAAGLDGRRGAGRATRQVSRSPRPFAAHSR